MDAYASAKANILRHQRRSNLAVLSADDGGARALEPLVQGRLRTFSLSAEVQDGAFLRGDEIVLRDGNGEQVICATGDVRLRGRHNVLNVLAAIVLADSVGAPAAAMQAAIRRFTGLEHRLELVRTVRGVQYVNDSIATAPERAIAALEAFAEPVILLAGGRDKEMFWDVWAATVARRAKAAVLFGSLADLMEMKLAEAMNQSGRELQLVRVDTLDEAVDAAARLASSGDVVLLAPGGTSYDAFADFAERGHAFRRLVAALAE
jgi:UDP-N-acetylmuramoylalanine--D-glutamate ligase